MAIFFLMQTYRISRETKKVPHFQATLSQILTLRGKLFIRRITNSLIYLFTTKDTKPDKIVRIFLYVLKLKRNHT